MSSRPRLRLTASRTPVSLRRALLGGTACLLLVPAGGCGGKHAERATSSPPSKRVEARAQDALAPYLHSTDQALRSGDLEAASVTLRGATDLLTQLGRRQPDLQHREGEQLAVDSLLTAADQHATAAAELSKQKLWDLAGSHYETAAALLQVAAQRVSAQVTAEANRFNNAYTDHQKVLQQAYERETKGRKLSEKQQTSVLSKHQAKLEKLNAEWAPKRQAFDKQLEKMKATVARQRSDLIQRRCRLYVSLAEVRRAQGNPVQAGMQELMAHQELAALYDGRDDLAGAEAEYRAWVKMRPEEVAPRLGLAWTLERQRKWEAAEKEYRQVLQRNPTDTETHAQLARVLARAQKWEPCVAAWKTVIAVKEDQLSKLPDTGPLAKESRQGFKAQLGGLRFELAEAYRQAERKAEAKAEYASAVELDPSLKGRVPKGD